MALVAKPELRERLILRNGQTPGYRQFVQSELPIEVRTSTAFLARVIGAKPYKSHGRDQKAVVPVGLAVALIRIAEDDHTLSDNAAWDIRDRYFEEVPRG